MTSPIIKLKELSKHYGTLRAVDTLSLEVHKGEIFGLLGPNGAGKTTTILMMLGLTEPTSGKAIVCGVDATRHPIEVKRKVGYMPDSVGFYNNLTALENLMYVGRLNGIADAEIEERAQETLELVGLKGKMRQKASTYSRGMKQRLGLADVLIRDPEVVILDEPTLGIDPKGIKEFLNLIHRLSREAGLTVLLSSHHLHQVQQICDRVGIFVEGRLLVEGEIQTLAKELFNQESFQITVESTFAVDPEESFLMDLKTREYIETVTVEGQKIKIAAQKDVTPAIIRFLVQNGVAVNAIRKKEFGLDEIYHRYFEDVGENESPSAERNGGLLNLGLKTKHP